MEDSWDWERRIFTPGPVVTDKGPSYAVRDLPGRGKGVIAQRTIRQGEILMLDHPAVLVASDFSSQMQPEMRETFFRRALSQLPRDTQKRLVNLARSDGADPLTPVYDIVTTNTCGVFLGDNVAHIGLFPEVSRLNHACKPNAFFRFSQRTLTMQVIAYRDIHAGEEITINYAPLGMPHKVRKKYLFDNYGFHCRCSLCQSSPEDRAISDARRMRIVEVRGNMRKAHEKGKLSDAITYAEELLSLSEAEGLTPLMHEYHEILASIYLEQLDIPNARKYGQMTLDGWIRFKSVDSFHVEAVRGFMRQIDHVEEMLRETKGVYS
ncbi:SET domain-containing protein 5 like [Verticillium longisporum]|nr:SET domain-containing protein 5 like [Verticillium longisporum]